jgi:hypothetical protein
LNKKEKNGGKSEFSSSWRQITPFRQNRKRIFREIAENPFFRKMSEFSPPQSVPDFFPSGRN